MIFRVCPPGWTGDTLNKLNELLKDGYEVIGTNTITTDGKGTFTDYLIEKKTNSVGQ
jgi:hypothetical protein